MVRINTTHDEYQISLTFDQRFRAKRIPGYRWDPSLKSWCFPRNSASRKAILSEFGPEELGDFSFEEEASSPYGIFDLTKKLIGANQELLETNQELIGARKEVIRTAEKLIAANEMTLDLWNVAEKFGLPDECDLDEFVAFTKASYEANAKHADLVAKLASTEVRLNVVTSELANLTDSNTRKDEDTFTQTMILKVWGSSSAPTAVRNFTFDARGVMDLQNYLIKAIEQKLGAIGNRVPFADLIREAEDKGVLSSTAARTCHSLRIQRNHFAHESVVHSEVFPRAMLCLASFTVVYQEVQRDHGAL